MNFLIYNNRHRSLSDVAAPCENETRWNRDRHRDSSSTWIIVLLVLLRLCQLTRWLPRLCSSLHGPRCSVSWFYKPRGRRVAKPKICRKASLLKGNAPQLDPCQHGLVSNGKSHLVMDPSDVARRVVECNLRVVWRGSQWVDTSVCMYVCYCKMWWNCGWRWDNKAIISVYLLLTYV